LALSYGVIERAMGTFDGRLIVSITNTESVFEKYQLMKKLMMAPVPLQLLLVISPIHGLKALVKF